MSRKESNNGLQLIKYASISLRGKFSALFMGTFAMVTPLALSLIIPIIFALLFEKLWILSIGVVLFAILVGPLQIGYMRYFGETINGEQPKLTRVYSGLNISTHTVRSMYIAMLLFAMYLIGGLLWLVTAGFVIAFFSMSLFFLEKLKLGRMTVAMKKCAIYMIGNRLAMFSYKLIFYFVYFLLFVLGALFLALIYVVSIDSLLVAWIVSICSVIIFIFLYSFITLYFHASNEIFFQDLLMYREREEEKERKAKEKAAKKEEITTAENVVEKKLDKNEEKVDKIEDKEKKKEPKKIKATKEKVTKTKKTKDNSKEDKKSKEKTEEKQ